MKILFFSIISQRYILIYVVVGNPVFRGISTFLVIIIIIIIIIIIEKWLVCLRYIGTQYPRMIGHFNQKTIFVKTKFKTRNTMNGVIS